MFSRFWLRIAKNPSQVQNSEVESRVRAAGHAVWTLHLLGMLALCGVLLISSVLSFISSHIDAAKIRIHPKNVKKTSLPSTVLAKEHIEKISERVAFPTCFKLSSTACRRLATVFGLFVLQLLADVVIGLWGLMLFVLQPLGGIASPTTGTRKSTSCRY